MSAMNFTLGFDFGSLASKRVAEGRHVGWTGPANALATLQELPLNRLLYQALFGDLQPICAEYT